MSNAKFSKNVCDGVMKLLYEVALDVITTGNRKLVCRVDNSPTGAQRVIWSIIGNTGMISVSVPKTPAIIYTCKMVFYTAAGTVEWSVNDLLQITENKYFKVNGTVCPLWDEFWTAVNALKHAQMEKGENTLAESFVSTPVCVPCYAMGVRLAAAGETDGVYTCLRHAIATNKKTDIPVSDMFAGWDKKGDVIQQPPNVRPAQSPVVRVEQQPPALSPPLTQPLTFVPVDLNIKKSPPTPARAVHTEEVQGACAICATFDKVTPCKYKPGTTPDCGSVTLHTLLQSKTAVPVHHPPPPQPDQPPHNPATKKCFIEDCHDDPVIDIELDGSVRHWCAQHADLAL
jgi:hypothetical protein